MQTSRCYGARQVTPGSSPLYKRTSSSQSYGARPAATGVAPDIYPFKQQIGHFKTFEFFTRSAKNNLHCTKGGQAIFHIWSKYNFPRTTKTLSGTWQSCWLTMATASHQAC